MPAVYEDGTCGCEASEHGCCLDGVSFAVGKDFQGLKQANITY